MTEPTARHRPLDAMDRHVAAAGIDPAELHQRLDHLLTVTRPRLARLWAYYRNPTRTAVVSPTSTGDTDRAYRQAQEVGLPRRIVGPNHTAPLLDAGARREVVIENDIGWRVDTMVDFLFGRPIRIRSLAPDPTRAAAIASLLHQVLTHHGGLPFLQQLAVVGMVHGQVDLLVKLVDAAPAAAGESSGRIGSELDPARIVELAGRVRLEIVDPSCAVALLDDPAGATPDGVRAYAVIRTIPGAPVAARGMPAVEPVAGFGWRAWWRRRRGDRPDRHTERTPTTWIDLITPDRWMRFRDGHLLGSGENALGRIPLVHVQNLADPFEWTGAGDVAPLIPLQDELNTRLSDRAHRITMQSFRMYLGKGIEQFTEQPVAPGRMWMTDNPDAQIVEFGGDAACPSEDAHVREIREAMDKVSGVTPIAAGILRHRIGRLTSGAALRVTLLALMARTHRKRLTYGRGIARACELALAWLDRAGLFRTDPHERAVEIDWPDPIDAIAGPTPSQITA